MWLAMEGIGVRKKGGDSGAFIGGRWAPDCQNFVCSLLGRGRGDWSFGFGAKEGLERWI
jgi:hypothetical protein